jgi:hypothetical protein
MKDLRFGRSYIHTPAPKYVYIAAKIVKRITGVLMIGDASISFKYDTASHPTVIMICGLMWIVVDELLPFIGTEQDFKDRIV